MLILVWSCQIQLEPWIILGVEWAMKSHRVSAFPVLILLVTIPAAAQSLIPDPGFGDSGESSLAYPQNAGCWTSMRMTGTADGGVLMLSWCDTGGGYMIHRYNVDGSLDTTFGTGGFLLVDSTSNGYPAQLLNCSDGRILVGCTHSPFQNFREIVLHRFMADGTPDATFGSNGTKVLSPYDYNDLNGLLDQPDGKLLLLDSPGAGIGVVRVLPDGNLDPSFGVNGRAVVSPGYSCSASCFTIDQAGGIILGGARGNAFNVDAGVITRLNSDGSLDTSFGDSGFVLHDVIPYNSQITYQLSENFRCIQVDDLGNIYAGGTVTLSFPHERSAIVRYHSNGTIDPTFGVNGMCLITPDTLARTFPRSLSLRPEGEVIMLSYSTPADGNYDSQVLTRVDQDGNVIGPSDNGGCILWRPSPVDYMGMSPGLVVRSNGRIVIGISYVYLAIDKIRLAGFIRQDVNAVQETARDNRVINVFPNPARTSASVTYALQAPSVVRILLYDHMGRMMRRSDPGEQPSGQYTVAFDDLYNLEPGVYTVLLDSGKYRYHTEIVIAP